MQIRPATLDDILYLSELCFLSKAHWGYDAVFMEECRAELSFVLEDIDTTDIAVAVEGKHLLGVAQLREKHGEIELEKLFVHPDHMGRGVGRALFGWAVDQFAQFYSQGSPNLKSDLLYNGTAESSGFKIVSDPFASEFYLKQGALLIGHALSETRENRWLPLFYMKSRNVS